MQISLIDPINLIALINILINLAPDCLAPMQISLPQTAWRLFKLVYSQRAWRLLQF